MRIKEHSDILSQKSLALETGTAGIEPTSDALKATILTTELNP